VTVSQPYDGPYICWVLKVSVSVLSLHSVKHQLLQCKLEAFASRLTVRVLEYYGFLLRIIVLQLHYTSTTVTDKYCNQLLRVK